MNRSDVWRDRFGQPEVVSLDSVGQAVPDEVAAMGCSRVRHSLTYKD